MKRNSIKHSFDDFFDRKQLPSPETVDRILQLKQQSKKPRTIKWLPIFIVCIVLISCAALVINVIQKTEQRISVEPSETPISSDETNAENAETIQLNHIQMFSQFEGWSKYENELLKTTDGGATWVASSPQTKISATTDFFILNEATAWLFEIEEDQLKTYKTLNGGESWAPYTNKIEGDIRAVHFVDEQIGTILTTLSNNEVSLYRTTNGGETWKAIAHNLSTLNFDNISEITFLNEDIGWMTGKEINSQQLAILTTLNGGITWQYRELPMIADIDLTHYKTEVAVNSDQSYIVLHANCAKQQCAVIYGTEDAGQTWYVEHIIHYDNKEDSIHIVAADDAWFATDSGGTVYYSIDNEQTWQSFTLNVPNPIKTSDFVDSTHGFIITDDNLYVTVDRITWQPIQPKLIRQELNYISYEGNMYSEAITELQEIAIEALGEYYSAIWNGEPMRLSNYITNKNLQNYMQTKINTLYSENVDHQITHAVDIDVYDYTITLMEDGQGEYFIVELFADIISGTRSYGDETHMLLRKLNNQFVIVDWYNTAKDSYDFIVRGENENVFNASLWDDIDWVNSLDVSKYN